MHQFAVLFIEAREANGTQLKHATFSGQVEKRQKEFCRLRMEAAACLKDALPLLMSTEGVMAAVAPLQKLLVSEMRGLSAGVLTTGKIALPVTPVQHGSSTPKAPPPTVPPIINQVHSYRYLTARSSSQKAHENRDSDVQLLPDKFTHTHLCLSDPARRDSFCFNICFSIWWRSLARERSCGDLMPHVSGGRTA